MAVDIKNLMEPPRGFSYIAPPSQHENRKVKNTIKAELSGHGFDLYFFEVLFAHSNVLSALYLCFDSVNLFETFFC